jgi:hypothetical protein
MKPDAYKESIEDDVLLRVRDVVCPDSKSTFRVCLPRDEMKFWDSLRFADDICEHVSDFVKAFELFKAEQKQHFLRQYDCTGSRFFRDCCEEIDLLMIKTVDFFGGDHPNEAEVRCAEIPGSWRAWWCGYADGNFSHLNYGG